MIAESVKDGIEPEKIARYLMASREVIRGGNLAELSKRYKLDATILENWTKALRLPEVKEPDHPLFVWSQFLDGDVNPVQTVFDRRYQEIRRRLADRHKQSGDSVKGAVKFADFTEDSYADAGWFTTGFAYGDGPSGIGE